MAKILSGAGILIANSRSGHIVRLPVVSIASLCTKAKNVEVRAFR